MPHVECVKCYSDCNTTLQLDQILQAQKVTSENYDEHFFVVVHQGELYNIAWGAKHICLFHSV